MKRITRTAVAVALIAVPVAVSACTPQQIAAAQRHAAAHHSARPAVVTIEDSSTVTVDVRPPQRLDVRVRPVDASDASLAAADERCADMGGTPDWQLGPTLLMCRGVGY